MITAPTRLSADERISATVVVRRVRTWVTSLVNREIELADPSSHEEVELETDEPAEELGPQLRHDPLADDAERAGLDEVRDREHEREAGKCEEELGQPFGVPFGDAAHHTADGEWHEQARDEADRQRDPGDREGRHVRAGVAEQSPPGDPGRDVRGSARPRAPRPRPIRPRAGVLRQRTRSRQTDVALRAWRPALKGPRRRTHPGR